MPLTTGSFEEQPRWVGGDADIEFRATDRGKALDDEDVVVADCAPPDYLPHTDPHNGALDAPPDAEVE